MFMWSGFKLPVHIFITPPVGLDQKIKFNKFISFHIFQDPYRNGTDC